MTKKDIALVLVSIWGLSNLAAYHSLRRRTQKKLDRLQADFDAMYQLAMMSIRNENRQAQLIRDFERLLYGTSPD